MSSPDKIEKLMSISRAEFLASLEHVGGAREVSVGYWTSPLEGGGTADIHFEPVAGVRLGGLLELPRARVSIVLNGGSASARSAFMHRFDLAFQRGGG
jgi:hypothetical protein